MRVGYLGLALTLTALLACRRTGNQQPGAWGTAAEPKAAPVGNGMFASSCKGELAPCYAQASAACPGGFDVVSTNESGPNARELIVRCRAAGVSEAQPAAANPPTAPTSDPYAGVAPPPSATPAPSSTSEGPVGF